jgi:uncharacterized protein (TIGR02145 family)
VYGDPVTDTDGQTYETVVIGKQTWMKKNLNRNVDGSKCYNDSDINCTIYGRLYDWAMVMNGADGSDKYPSGVQGICPAGFHVPSDVEWTVLIDYVIDYAKLRSTSGWSGRNNFNGTDDYGFSALASGRRYYDDRFTNVGYNGYWWSTTEGESNLFVNDDVFLRNGAGDKDVGFDGNRKSNMYSLRCLKDGYVQPSSSSYIPVSCTNVPAGGFCDARDGKAYKSVTIDNDTWMAENLNHKVEGSFCYGEASLTDEEAQANCALYGRLYNWAAAMAVEQACNDSYCASHITHKGVCPDGWHLPTVAETNGLITFAGGKSTAGQVLKAESGWGNNGNGYDVFGFSALPGGTGAAISLEGRDYGIFSGVGTFTGWWNVMYGSNSRQRWSINTGIDVYGPASDAGSGSSGLSVRCVKD